MSGEGVVTLVVNPESRSLYEEALARIAAGEPVPVSGVDLNGRGWSHIGFVLETRPPTEAEIEADRRAEVARAYEQERAAVNRGSHTLAEIRKHLRDKGLDDPQRAYWRDAQRRHRAVHGG